jgi:hypothetical protein
LTEYYYCGIIYFMDTPDFREPQLPQHSPERCVSLFEQHEYLKGLSEWFGLPQEIRDAAVDQAIRAGLEAPEESLPHLLELDEDEDALNPQDQWVLRNFAVLTSPTTQALLDPENHNPVVFKNRYNDFSDYTATYAQEHFTDLVNEKRLAAIEQLCEHQGMTKVEASRQTPHLYAEAGEAADFLAPNEFIRRNFSVEEMRNFIIQILDKTPPSRDLASLLNSYDHGVIGVAHQELILDDVLMSRLPENSFRETVETLSLGDLLSASLRTQSPLPSATLVEKLMQIKSAQSDDMTFEFQGLDYQWVDMPLGALLMGLVRRSAYNMPNERYIEPYEQVLSKTADYLSSNMFMERLLLYIDSDAKFNDVLWRGQGSPRFDNLRDFEGRQPQEVKRQWLQEVTDIVVTYLREIGDIERAELVSVNAK